MKSIWKVLYNLFIYLTCGQIGILLCVHDVESGKLFILVLMIIAAMVSVFLTFLFGALYQDEITEDK